MNWRFGPAVCCRGALADVIEAAHALREQGIAHVVISLDADGALWLNASGAWLAKPPACEVVSTVGAGDSMVGGLCIVLSFIFGIHAAEQLGTLAAALMEIGSKSALALMVPVLAGASLPSR